jgi:hypothetical protein
MSIRNVPGIANEPEITLKPWLVLKCGNGQRYLVGFNVRTFEGRASTAIVDTDLATMTVRTLSGRLYRLDGPPGLDLDAWHTWLLYAKREGLAPIEDVSVELWPTYDSSQCPVIDSRVEAIGEALQSPPRKEPSIEGLTPMEALRVLTDEDSSEPGETLH